ncbi:hypothetical protein [uncultured Draconibacterium sp.]|uniref:hypothetical protein n=1 Tax=uncultured Draconibacterium sp. TaxID=1573823 RepID=UPI003748CE56
MQYIETLNISKREFYAKTGISRGTLESGTGITEDILAKFIVTYDEISVEWLILGDGPTLKKEKKEVHSSSDSALLLQIIKEKDSQLRQMAEEIGALKEQNRTLKKQIGYSNPSIAAEK